MIALILLSGCGGSDGVTSQNTNPSQTATAPALVQAAPLIDPLMNPATHNIVLGRPTDTSIGISILSEDGDQARIAYSRTIADVSGQTGGTLIDELRSEIVTGFDNYPIVVDLHNLVANTQYFYRVDYKAASATDFTAGSLHSFRTARAKGDTYSFGVQGDTHPERNNNQMFNPDLYRLTMEQVRTVQPDLYFMLGDDFSTEAYIEQFKEDYVRTIGSDLGSRCRPANDPACYPFKQSVEGFLSDTAHERYESLPEDVKHNPDDFIDNASQRSGVSAYREQREEYLGLMTHSTALFPVNGNHEQASKANLGGIFHVAAVSSAEGRLKYYPLPKPTSAEEPTEVDFYTGDIQPLIDGDYFDFNGFDETVSPEDKLLRDYYAFEWGDALYVTIDPYWHSDWAPDTGHFNGDTEGGWETSMGDEQYQWLTSTLENSSAKWKFIFAHHINGTGRGAANVVGIEEWGGGNGEEFATYRPTWEKPIHQLLVDTGVTIFFQAHDHIYSREIVDGIVYQEVPNPADNSYYAYNCEAYAPDSIRLLPRAGGDKDVYGIYDPATAVVLPNTGFLNVTVAGDESVTVDYLRSYRDEDLQGLVGEHANEGQFLGYEKNGEIAFSYSVHADGSIADGEVLGNRNLADQKGTPICGKSPSNEWWYFNNGFSQ